jgi:hypothetical protein
VACKFAIGVFLVAMAWHEWQCVQYTATSYNQMGSIKHAHGDNNGESMPPDASS